MAYSSATTNNDQDFGSDVLNSGSGSASGGAAGSSLTTWLPIAGLVLAVVVIAWLALKKGK